MSESMKAIMDDEGAHIKIDRRLLKKVKDYGIAFVNKNEDHIAFFGGNLVGVNPVRFTTPDRNSWLDDVLEVDDYSIRQRVIKLPAVKPEWRRATDTMNISCLWLCHKIYSSDLPAKVKEEGMIDVLMVLHFKLISSLMAHYFPYPADESVALATYAALSKKFSLKVYGSWYKLLQARCEDIISKKSIHRKVVEYFDDDTAIVYAIQDIQLRIRTILKNLWAVFNNVRTQDAKIVKSKGLVETDGNVVVRDMARNFAPYKRYIHEVIQNKTSWMKEELIQVVTNAMHTMPEKPFRETLEYMYQNYGQAGDKAIEELLDETLLHAFEYLSKDRRISSRIGDMAGLVTRLRANYMSSRSSDPGLMKMRKLGESIVKKVVKSRNPSVISSIRTGLFLYIVIRTFSRQYYG